VLLLALARLEAENVSERFRVNLKSAPVDASDGLVSSTPQYSRYEAAWMWTLCLADDR
jgi:hypothetical protein